MRKVDAVNQHFEKTASDLEMSVVTAKRGVSQVADQMIAEIHEYEW